MALPGTSLRILQHVHRQSRGVGGEGEAVVRRGNDHADELDAFLAAQRLEHGRAEVAGPRQNTVSSKNSYLAETPIVRGTERAPIPPPVPPR